MPSQYLLLALARFGKMDSSIKTEKILRTGLFVLLLGLAALFFVFNPAENGIYPRCMFHSLTGYYCPGCGSQRAVHHLLHLNLTGVAGNNFLFIPAALLLIYHYIHPWIALKFNRKLPNVFYYKKTPWIILFVIVLFWFLRNLPFYPFLLLAPN